MTALVGLAPAPAAPRTVCVLGSFDLVVDGASVFVGDAGAVLVALLAVTSQRSRDEVQATLWPDCDAGQAPSRLRSLLYRIRRVAGEDIVQSVGAHRLRIAPDVDVDFRRASKLVRDIGARRAPVGASGDVVDLLSQELLPSVHDEWALPHKWAWSRARLGALVTYAHQCAETGDWIGASAAAETVLASEPFNEPAHYLLVVTLLRDGFAHAARQMYDALAAMLRHELGCAPRRSYEDLVRVARREPR